MKEVMDIAVRGGYMPSPAVKYAGCNNGEMVKDGPQTLDGWSVWVMTNESSFCESHYRTMLKQEFWQALSIGMGWVKPGDELIDWKTGKESEAFTVGQTFHRINLAKGWTSAMFFLEGMCGVA